MKTTSKIALIFAAVFALSGCYDKFVSDAPESSVCFALRNPLRSVIDGRDMEIYVGVSIGGKRAVNMNDWAKFEIDPTLLAGTSFTLLPPNYYALSNPDTFHVRKSNMPVADVRMTFTADFYNDPNVVKNYYALPLRITESSLDVVTEGKQSTIVVIKCLNACHGTYYVKGTLDSLNAAGGTVMKTTLYSDKDLSKNITRDISTVTKQTVRRPGVANAAADVGNILLDVAATPDTDGTYAVALTTGGTGAATAQITHISGKYTPGERPEFHLVYEYEKGGVFYKADEVLILRQDPYYDLRVEQW